MKRLSLIGALLWFGFLAVGCTPEQEAKWSAVANSVRAGIAVTAAAARQTLDEVCAQQVVVIPAAQTAVSLAQGGGPRSQAAARNINAGISAYVAACQGGTANASVASLVVRAWNAYQAIKAAQAESQAAGGS